MTGTLRGLETANFSVLQVMRARWWSCGGAARQLAVERSVVGIDEIGQIMRQGNSLDVGSSLWVNKFTVVCFVLLWEKPSLNT